TVSRASPPRGSSATMLATSWIMPVNMRALNLCRRRHWRHWQRREAQIRPHRLAFAELQSHALLELRDRRQFCQWPRRGPEQAWRQIDDELIHQTGLQQRTGQAGG